MIPPSLTDQLKAKIAADKKDNQKLLEEKKKKQKEESKIESLKNELLQQKCKKDAIKEPKIFQSGWIRKTHTENDSFYFYHEVLKRSLNIENDDDIPSARDIDLGITAMALKTSEDKERARITRKEAIIFNYNYF